jgi:hypothetical protein
MFRRSNQNRKQRISSEEIRCFFVSSVISKRGTSLYRIFLQQRTAAHSGQRFF